MIYSRSCYKASDFNLCNYNGVTWYSLSGRDVLYYQYSFDKYHYKYLFVYLFHKTMHVQIK